MMSAIFCGMILFSVAVALLTGRMEDVSQAAMNEGATAVQLVISILGVMCLWSGLMRVAEKAGLTAKVAKALCPLTRLAFPGLDPHGKAMQAISMNMSANLLGLGNAATPLGIVAMQELSKESPIQGIASNHMVMFVVLNTAALDLLPTTTGLLRMQAGSVAPFDILPAVWVASSASVAVGIILTKFLSKFSPIKKETSDERSRYGKH